MERCEIKNLWKGLLADPFNTVSVGRLFRSRHASLVVGQLDGIVRLYLLPKSSGDVALTVSSSLETKGGPIQAQAISDVTRLDGNDIVVADSKGLVTIFSKGQIMARKFVSEHAIQHLTIEDTQGKHLTIITADSDGNLSAFSAYADLWNLRLPDLAQLKAVGMCPKVKSLLPVKLTSIYGHTVSYLLATDNCSQLYVIQNGDVVMICKTPQDITAMCSGTFVDPEEIETNETDGDPTAALKTQVALGSDSGAIYIMANFEVYPSEFCNINFPIREMATLKASESQATDSILCAGHFNALTVIRNGEKAGHHTLPDWINSIVTDDISGSSSKNTVIVGCQDNSIHGLEVHIS